MDLLNLWNIHKEDMTPWFIIKNITMLYIVYYVLNTIYIYIINKRYQSIVRARLEIREK